MHTEPHEFFKELKENYPVYFKEKNVLEVGSLDINGSIRSLFEDCNYLGIDIGEGPGVDRVIAIHNLHEHGRYHIVASTEMLEHDKYWRQSLISMYDNLKSGGMLVVTCAGPSRQEHGTTRTTPGDSPFTNDWYRNISIEDFHDVLPVSMFEDSYIAYLRNSADLVFWGIKP